MWRTDCMENTLILGKNEGRRRRGRQRMSWTWVWVRSGSWWWTGKPGVLQSVWSQIVRHDWETKWNSFCISLSNEYSELIYLKICWFDLLAVQEIFRSLLQHHNYKASILLCSAFFTVQLSQPYMTMEKTVVLTLWIFVVRVMSLHLNTLSRFVIAFLPKSKHLLVSQLQSSSAVILEPKKRKFVTTYSFPFLHCFLLLYLAIYKAFSDNLFAFLLFFFFRMILFTASCIWYYRPPSIILQVF